MNTPDQQPIPFHETPVNFIDRRADEIKAEISAMVKSAHRSIGQNFRYIKERISNNGTINRRKK